MLTTWQTQAPPGADLPVGGTSTDRVTGDHGTEGQEGWQLAVTRESGNSGAAVVGGEGPLSRV